MSWWRLCIIWIAICIVLTIVAMMTTIFLHRRMYKYWSSKPVSWMTIFPQSNGIIDEQMSASSFTVQPLPPGCRLTQISSSQRGSVERTTHFLNNHADAPYRRSPTHVHWTLNCPDSRTYTLQENDQIIGMIHASRCLLDTPSHQGLPCQFIDSLVIARNKRNNGRCTLLIDRVIHDCPDTPSIGFFLSERRMPWAEVAAFSRYSTVVNPTLLPESTLDVSFRRVDHPKQLPTKAFECSRIRVEGGATLEPTPDAKRWAHFVHNPYHEVVSVNGEDWIHLQWLPPHSEVNDEAHSEEEIEFTHMIRSAPAVLVRGFSLEKERVQPFLFAYLRSRADKGADTGDTDLTHLIVSAPLQDNLDLGGASVSPWRLYDEQFLYFYNYRLNKYDIHVPHTWNLNGE